MKKKLISLFLILTLAVILTACGSKSSSEDLSNMDTKELMERIEELEKENEKLSTKLDEDKESDTSKQIEQETWSDDTIIAFAGEWQLLQMRKFTGITERDITYGDVKGITEVYWDGDVYPLRYFTALKTLHADGIGNNMNGLENLHNLTVLDIQGGEGLTDLSPISNLTNLVELRMTYFPDLEDLSPLSNLTNLKSIYLTTLPKIQDLSPISKLTNLESFTLSNGDEKITLDNLQDFIN